MSRLSCASAVARFSFDRLLLGFSRPTLLALDFGGLRANLVTKAVLVNLFCQHQAHLQLCFPRVQILLHIRRRAFLLLRCLLLRFRRLPLLLCLVRGFLQLGLLCRRSLLALRQLLLLGGELSLQMRLEERLRLRALSEALCRYKGQTLTVQHLIAIPTSDQKQCVSAAAQTTCALGH